MNHIITQVMKYLLVLTMVGYTAGSFQILTVENPHRMRYAFYRQVVLVLLFHAFGFSVIMLHEQTLEILGMYLAELLFMLLYVIIFRLAYRNCSRVILSHVLMFLAIGFIMLTRINTAQSLKQLMMVLVFALITLIVPQMFKKEKTAVVWSWILGIFGLLLLMVVLVFSSRTYGANLTLELGVFSFQPSEFAKISFVLLIAAMFRYKHNFGVVLLTGIVALFHILILVASTDLGGAMIYAFAYLFMVYVATGRVFYLLGGTVVGAGAAAAAYFLFAHVRTRVAVWLDPWPLMSGKGNQVCNSLLGMASGGFMGTGLYQGSPKLIPIVQKDFIFSAIVEEMGAIIGICIILICVSCMLKFLQVACRLKHPYYRLIGVGMAAVYGIQVFLSIGGNIKFIPATGVTLPFVSYGGSSIGSTFILFVVMQELFIRNNGEEARKERLELEIERREGAEEKAAQRK